MNRTSFETLSTAFAASPTRRAAMRTRGGLGLTVVGRSAIEAKHRTTFGDPWR